MAERIRRLGLLLLLAALLAAPALAEEPDADSDGGVPLLNADTAEVCILVTDTAGSRLYLASEDEALTALANEGMGMDRWAAAPDGWLARLDETDFSLLVLERAQATLKAYACVGGADEYLLMLEDGGQTCVRLNREDCQTLTYDLIDQRGGQSFYRQASTRSLILLENGSARHYDHELTSGGTEVYRCPADNTLLVMLETDGERDCRIYRAIAEDEAWVVWEQEGGEALLVENLSASDALPAPTWESSVASRHRTVWILSAKTRRQTLTAYDRVSGLDFFLDGDEANAFCIDSHGLGYYVRTARIDGEALYVNEGEAALVYTAEDPGLRRYEQLDSSRRWRVFGDGDTALVENLAAGNLAKDTAWQNICFGLNGNAGLDHVVMINDQTSRRYQYDLMAVDGDWAMYACPETLAVTVCGRATGLVMSSALPAGDIPSSVRSINGATYSGVVIYARNGTSLSSSEQVDLLRMESHVTWEPLEKGFVAHVSIPEKYGFSFDLRAELDGDSVVVTIPDESIRESNPTYTITWLELFPMMGAANQDDNPQGYLFVPDGTGGLIAMTEKHGRFSTGYQSPVYGADDGFWASSSITYLYDTVNTLNDTYTALMPVFGLARTDLGQGYVAIIESGDTRCRITASPNGVTNFSYNRIYAGFHLREAYRQKTTNIETLEEDRYHADLSVRYCFLTGDDATYAGMAVRYREYLLASGGLVQRDTAYRTRVDFLGSERENFLAGTRAVEMTSVEDAREIIDDLRSQGVTTSLTAFKGWQSGGLYALPVDSFSVDGAVGGDEAFRQMVQDEAAMGARIYPYVDALRMNAATNTFTHDVAKMHSQDDIAETSRASVYKTFYYMLPASSAQRLRSLGQSLRANGVSGVAVGGVTGKLFSYSARDTYYGRGDCAEIYSGLLEELSQDMTLALESPNAYLWPSMSAFLDLPLHSSGYQYIDQEIPFLALVLKGVVPTYSEYVNFEANKREFFLQLVESGVYPSFYITRENASALIYTNSSDLYSVQFSSYRETIIDYDRQLRALAQATEGAVIVNHVIDGDLRCVTYSNGVKVYVNYGDVPADASEGFTVEAMGYAVWKEGSEP